MNDEPTEGTVRLYVCNLPYNFLRDHVAQTFSAVEPRDIIVPAGNQPGRLNCGYAFLSVSSSNLEKALEYHGQQDPFFGRVLKVEVARERRPRPYQV